MGQSEYSKGETAERLRKIEKKEVQSDMGRQKDR